MKKIKATIIRLVTPDPFAGSILDLVGGRTYQTNSQDYMEPVPLLYWPRAAKPSPLWWPGEYSHETLGARAQRIGRAFLNVRDLF